MKNYSQKGNIYNGQLCQTTKRKGIYKIRTDQLEVTEHYFKTNTTFASVRDTGEPAQGTYQG